MFARASGLLLHVTSLPGGRLGPEADRFVDFLAAAGQKWWQLLPVGPPGYGGSPYAALSAFAGNEDFAPGTDTPAERPVPPWLQDYARFRALKEHFGGKPWWEWPENLPADPDTRTWIEAQWRFDDAWSALRRRARDAGVQLLGDLPLFVAKDSADVWAHRDLFDLDHVAGVPPDYFNEEGQLWGNPQYAWDAHAGSDYAWWAARVERQFELFDAVRIDHFLGLHRTWSIPAHEDSAKNGTWQPAPGAAILEAIGKRALVAENLGVVTPEAEALRARFGIPGMHVLQFSFGEDRRDRPFWFDERAVVYTGTHDNDTTRSWSDEPDAARAQRYLGCAREELPEAMLRLAWMSRPDLAIAPVQDLLGLDATARMNAPGTTDGNWDWKLRPGQLTDEHAAALRALTEEAGR
ncbi:MAG: 4-alpha-glucanotransferase [Planctomycetota bacterium]